MAAQIGCKYILFQLLDKIATPFQRLTPIFGDQEFSQSITNIATCKRKSEIHDVGRETGSTYIYCSILDSNEIPNDTIELWTGCQWHYFSYCTM